MPHNFGPAGSSETLVYGAEKPGYSKHAVDASSVAEWLGFMTAPERAIERVCCLLPQVQLGLYDPPLLDAYRSRLGGANVHCVPVEDFHLVPLASLTGEGGILPFLRESVQGGRKVVVHCASGSGRTGVVLAGWLVHARGYDPSEALHAVTVAAPGYDTRRDPREAVWYGDATEARLIALLEACRGEPIPF
jgi:atypical dual specificity phosphatase